VNWSDNTSTLNIGPFASGEEVKVSHSWVEQDTYVVKVKSWDYYQAESEWTTLEVSMPNNKAIDTPFLLFLERLMERFPILEQLLQPIYDKLTDF